MRLFLLMLIVTSVEVVLISKVGSLIGFWATLLIIIGTAMLGSKLLRQQWGMVIGKLQSLQGEPSQAMLEALVLLICGVLLITPGFLTDIVGFLGLIPTVREQFVAFARRNAGRVMRGNFQVYGSFRQSSHQQSYTDNRTYTDDTDNVIEGEFERKD